MRSDKLFLFVLAIFWSSSAWCLDDVAPAKIVDLANEQIVKIGEDPVIVQAVRDENAKKKTLEQVKQLDEAWIKVKGISETMKAIMDNACSRHLRQIQKEEKIYSEIFVMDNLGANVCMSNKTTDYWQGDEDKWGKTFNNGKGAVFIDKVKFDESSQAYLVQVSVPVKDGGLVIGTITAGVDIDRVHLIHKLGHKNP